MLTAARMNAPPTKHPIIRHSRRCHRHNAPPTWEYSSTTLSHSTTRVRCSLFGSGVYMHIRVVDVQWDFIHYSAKQSNIWQCYYDKIDLSIYDLIFVLLNAINLGVCIRYIWMLLGHDRHPNGEHIQQNFGRRKVGVWGCSLFCMRRDKGRHVVRNKKKWDKVNFQFRRRLQCDNVLKGRLASIV